MESKKQFKFFTIFQHEKEEEYLQNMHKQGWKLKKVSGVGVYHFESCEPDDVVYRLDYNKDGLANNEEYIKIFSDCGWEHLFDYAGYSYFRKPLSNENTAEEIFFDDSSKLEMMRRVISCRMIPLLILFLLIILPQFIYNLIIKDYIPAILTGFATALYIVIFIQCAIRYNKHKKKK